MPISSHGLNRLPAGNCRVGAKTAPESVALCIRDVLLSHDLRMNAPRHACTEVRAARCSCEPTETGARFANGPPGVIAGLRSPGLGSDRSEAEHSMLKAGPGPTRLASRRRSALSSRLRRGNGQRENSLSSLAAAARCLSCAYRLRGMRRPCLVFESEALGPRRSIPSVKPNPLGVVWFF